MIGTAIADAERTTSSAVTRTAGVVVDREPIKPKLVGKGKCFMWRSIAASLCCVTCGASQAKAVCSVAGLGTRSNNSPDCLRSQMTPCRYKSAQERSSPPPGTRIQEITAAVVSADKVAVAAAAETKRVLDELLGAGVDDSSLFQSHLHQPLDVDPPAVVQHLPK